MADFTPTFFISSLLLAVFAFVYTNVLTSNGELLGKVFSSLHHFFKTDQRESQGLPAHPVFKVIIQCEKCVGGQLALWTFLFAQRRNYNVDFIIPHALFITLTIFFAIVVKSVYTKFIQ